ncbi:hypothetical protein TRFO_30956 [Tritrichomonas foetus]|uniref:Uncharacterized protein n=1 Tax=Tritrichomonas foetus TaxID=1144522 RepID=A0A1J4JU87_9EUKA|nr:hypothetical protein TRFO_30956 [Tritrichomonas foetus]|eukprot:OHT02040.1 hypothetical protein TRFO_30956 [Tritrichomonas foetus]
MEEEDYSFSPEEPQQPQSPTLLHRSPRSPRTPRSHRSPKVRQPLVLTEDDLEIVNFWADQAIFHDDDLSHCEIDILPKVILQIKTLRDSFLVNTQIDESHLADLALEKAKKVHQNLLVKSASVSLRNDLKKRLKKSNEKYEKTLEIIQNQEKNMCLLFDEQKKQLEQKQNEEIDNLENEWNSSVKIRSYNRTSPLLRELKRQAACLLADKNFDESRNVQKRAEIMEKEEIYKNHLEMQKNYEEQLKMLLKKHKEESRILQKNQEAKKNQHEKAKEAEIEIHTKIIEKIQREINETKNYEKVWSLKHRNDMAKTLPVILTDPSTRKKTITPGEFAEIKLPPLNTGKLAKKTFRSTQRFYDFNKTYT